MAEYDFDLFTIGAGSGGVRAARLAGAAGKRSAIAEEWTIGGTCVHRGCIPKKFYVFASHFADDFADAQAYGWRVGEPRFDWPTLVANKTQELKRLEGIYEQNLAKAGVEVLRGHAVLADAHTVEIDGKRVTAENILISTGSHPHMPEISGSEHLITSNEAFDLNEFPERVFIIGAGYIAVEFAGIFHGLGAGVTVIYRGEEILRGFDMDIRRTLREEMEKKGIVFCLETVIDKVEKKPDGLHAHTGHGGVMVADQIMVAAGRLPNTHGIGLVEAGVELARNGAVVVDHHSRSTIDNIFAIGDCTDRLNLTPVAIHEAVCLIETLYKDNPTTPDHRDVPTAVFSQPPVGTVGMSEEDAREEYGTVDIYRARFKPLKHTLSGRDETVMIKLVVDRASDKVVGAHMVGLDSGEIVQALGIAVKAGLTKAQFDATMAVHPTTAEELVLMAEPVAAGDSVA